MNIRQKIIKPKQSEKAKERYNLPLSNENANYMLKSQQNHNKQNNYHHMNQNGYQTYRPNNNVQMLKSLQLPKRLKTTANDDDRFLKKKTQKQNEFGHDLRSSQQIFNFKYKTLTDSDNFREDLTFGVVKNERKNLLTSREFLQQKRLKTQVLDEIIMNNKLDLSKSLNQGPLVAGFCANHTNKMAKYRLISQLSQGEQEMFYCSKCAINLLKRGFKIQELKAQEIHQQNNMNRLKNISKCELKLKSLQQRSRNLCQQDGYKHDMLLIQQQIQNISSKYESIFLALQQMRKKDILKLTHIYEKKESQRRFSHDNSKSIHDQIQSIERQIKQLIENKSILNMNENQYNFLMTNLMNKINKFQECLASQYVSNNNRHRLSFEMVTTNEIIVKLQQKMAMNDSLCFKKSMNSKELKGSLKNETIKVEESINTDQLKHPFRILFPNDQSQHIGEFKLSDRRIFNSNKMINSVNSARSQENMIHSARTGNNMLNSVRQCSSFAAYV